MNTKTKTNMKLLASSLLVCAAVTAGCHNANKKSTTQQASGIPPMNMAALNVPTAPPAAATPPAPTPPAVSMTPPAAAQPVVYDPPAAEPAASAEPVADASDSVAPVRRSRPAPAQPAARKASASSANAIKARYTIKKGDSLWSIAEAKYGDGNKWKRIAAANPKLNPNRVQAGQTITLP